MGTGNHSGPPEIVREHSFDAAIAAIAQTFPRQHELDEAIDWLLIRSPKRFFRLADGYYLWKMDKISEHFPQLRILYRYEEAAHTVTLIAATEIKALAE